MPIDHPEDDELESGIRNDGNRQRSSIPSFLFVTFMLWLLMSHNGEEFLARHQYQDALSALRYQKSNFTAWMNGTESNFSLPEPDPTVAPLLSHFLAFTGQPDPAWASYYQNITGFIHGDSVFHNVTPDYLHDITNTSTIPWLIDANAFMSRPNATNMTQVVERLGTWNWTASDKVALTVVEKRVSKNTELTENTILIHGRIELTDSIATEDLRLEFEGVHFISNGSVYGYAEPSGLRTMDIRQIPALVPQEFQNETAHLILPELNARIKQVEDYIDDGYIEQDSANDETAKTKCPFIFYGQVVRSNIPEWAMIEMEQELQHPTGIWTVPRPKLSIVGALVSKECGIIYEVKDTDGLRSKAFFRRVTNYASLSAVVYLILIVLISRQISHSRTPAGISRVSRWTFLSQAVIDSVSFAGHVTFAVLAEGRPSLSLVAPSFLACVLFVQEAQFSMMISEFQLPEDNASPPLPPPSNSPAPEPSTVALSNPVTAAPPRTDSAISRSGSNSYPPSANNTASSVPNPPSGGVAPAVAAPSPSPANTTNVPVTFWAFFFHHVRHDPQARLWLVFFFFLTFMVRIVLSPTLALVFVAAMYSSFWLPQIIRSAKKGRASGLTKEYIIGTTLCRLCIFLYFLACPKNVLDVTPRPWAYFLSSFVVFQVLVVLLQEALGPTFFLPSKYATERIYDYHPALPSLGDPEAADQNLGDCAICMDVIKVRGRRKSIDEKAREAGIGTSAGSRFFGKVGEVQKRKVYSLAPCHHLFHTECLEKWLAIKNICPQCRRPLPPL